jgi:hypothetical protein
MVLRIVFLIAVLVLGWAAWAVCSPDRDAYETAAYTLETPPEREGDPEIRVYAALALVTTPLAPPERPGEDSAFGRLFAFISGANAAERKISMTTPVFMDSGRMSFVVPRDVASAGTPAPRSPEVTLGAFPPGRYLALRFPGGRGGGNPEDAERRLRQWAGERDHDVAGDAVFAYYDPPWTPPPLRRNEVLLRLREP